MAGKHTVLTHRQYSRPCHVVPVTEDCTTCTHLQHRGGVRKPCCEMSLDLHNQEIDMLERKYGDGVIESQRAAQIIQYNFRQYAMTKKFERMHSTQDELRDPRLNMIDMSSDKDSVWSDVAVTSFPISSHVPISVDVEYSRPVPYHHHHRETVRNGVGLAQPHHTRGSPPHSSSPTHPRSPLRYSPVIDSGTGSDESLTFSRNDSRLVDLQIQHRKPDSDKARKRQYRIGLNLFNKKPDQGVKYLMEQKFLANSSRAVAEFLTQRKGLSKQMIGEYLGDLQNPFNQDVLVWVVRELDVVGIDLDQALRKLINIFRLPGEAQKIERVIERFSKWYCVQNPAFVQQFNTVDSIFLISFAIIMLNTDLHNSSIKPTSKMKLEGFIKNMKGIDCGKDIPVDMLTNIYNRIMNRELKTGADHVSQVRKVEETMIGKIPVLATPQRRLVCYCRLYEVTNLNKKEKLGLHQREIFLFNDVLVVTKIFAKKKDIITYTFRQSILLNDMIVHSFTNDHYQFGIKLISGSSRATLICFNARNSHDREKFVDDLVDSITELKEMRLVQAGIEIRKRGLMQRSRMSKDSGVADLDPIYVNDMSAYPQYWQSHTAKAGARSSSHTELDKGLRKSQSSRSVDSCVLSKTTYHV